MKRQPLATTEILKHFVFVTPPSEELSLVEEKREVEAEAESSATIGSLKVKGAVVLWTLAGPQTGPARGQKAHVVLGVMLTVVFLSDCQGSLLSLPRPHLP